MTHSEKEKLEFWKKRERYLFDLIHSAGLKADVINVRTDLSNIPNLEEKILNDLVALAKAGSEKL